MEKKKFYIQPSTKCFFIEPFTPILAVSEKTGYAIDNENADPSFIIPITEQDDDDDLIDTFVEID